MRYRCAACHRSLFHPAYTDPSGWVLGRVCAKKAGKLKPKRKSAACTRLSKRRTRAKSPRPAKKRVRVFSPIYVQAGQMDLFEALE